MDQTYRPKAGKVALVTGAARGLGRAFAERLAADGAIVVAADRDDAPELAAVLVDLGAPEARFHRLDVTDEAHVGDAARDWLAAYGRCDIVVNNAGVSPNASLEEMTLIDWRRTMAINVDSMFMVCKAVVPAMRREGWGRIVNIASNTLGLVIEGFSGYMASKGAVVGFTRGLATDLGQFGITVNCIAPGLTRTPNTEQSFPDGQAFEHFAQAQAIKRPGVPTDLVGAMSFLTSDDAMFMTGQTLIVDGGLLRVQ